MLKTECVDRGTTFDDAAWLNNRKASDDCLVAEHARDLTAELGVYPPVVAVVLPPAPTWEAHGPSDPGGLSPWLPNTGRYRTHYAWKRVGSLIGTVIPPDSLTFFGRTLFRILDLDSTMVPWQGLTAVPQPILITSSIAGICDTVNPSQDVELECFELIQPFRTFPLQTASLLTADTVMSAEEACTPKYP